MLIDCHVHTTRYSPCSHLSPYEACKLALSRGLDAIVITEHQIQWKREEIKELQQEFPQLKIYAGMEITLRENIDIIVISKNVGLQIPYLISFEELINKNLFDLEKSFIFVAHLFRWSSEIEFDENIIFPYIHGIEMNSINILLSGFKKIGPFYQSTHYALYEEIKNKWNLKPLYNTDSHSSTTIGLIANEIKSVKIPPDEEELALLLKEKDIYQYQNIDLLQKIFNN